MTSRDREAIHFLGLWALVTALCLVPLGLSAAFLVRAGELEGYDGVVRAQQRDRAVYGPATSENPFEYKVRLVRARRPVVLALGSSRMMQFREEFFTAGFTSAGGGMRSVPEGLRFLEHLPPDARPRVALIGVEFWWFHPGWAREHANTPPGDPTALTLPKVTAPFQLLLSRKLTPATVGRVLLRGDRSNDVTTQANLGITAIHSSSGFRPDGSYQPASAAFGLQAAEAVDQRFATTLRYVDEGAGFFRHAAEPDLSVLTELGVVLRRLTEHDVKVVLVLLPLAPPVRARMEARGPAFAYIARARGGVRALGYELHDFHDPQPLTADACEYFDGVHGGDVMSQRLLLDVAQRRPDSPLSPYLDLARMRNAVAEFRGHTLTMFEPVYRRPEVDFLRLGCAKERR